MSHGHLIHNCNYQNLFLHFLLLEIYLHFEINIVSAKIDPACVMWCVYMEFM